MFKILCTTKGFFRASVKTMLQIEISTAIILELHVLSSFMVYD